MKSTAHVLCVMGGGFFIVDLTYLIWSLQAHNFEVIGLITLGLSATLCILMAVYLDVVLRSLAVTAVGWVFEYYRGYFAY